MALLARTLADPKSIEELDVFTAIDDVNKFVDGIDRTNSEVIAKVREILNLKLVHASEVHAARAAATC